MAVRNTGVGVVVVIEVGGASVSNDAVGGAEDTGYTFTGAAFALEGGSLRDELASRTGSSTLSDSNDFVVIAPTVKTGLAVGDEGTSAGGTACSTG